MVNKILTLVLSFAVSATVVFGANAARFNVVKGDVGEKYIELVNDEESLGSAGFMVSDPHEKINDAYATRYGNPEDPDYDKEEWAVNLDNLGFFSITNDKALNSLLQKAPELGGFSPFNQLIYKKVNEEHTYIGHVDPETMLNIVGTKDPEVRKEFIAMFDPLDKWTQETFGGEVKVTTFEKLPAKPMMTFEVEFERPDDIVDWSDSFQEKFEAAFEKKKYIIAGFKNFKSTYEEDLEIPFERFDSYFVYSLCHFTYSYNVFNKGRPDTGIFAPCSMYVYVEKDSNKAIIGMPRLSNWVAVGEMKDERKIEWTKKLDAEIVSIMKSLGAKEI